MGQRPILPPIKIQGDDRTRAFFIPIASSFHSNTVSPSRCFPGLVRKSEQERGGITFTNRKIELLKSSEICCVWITFSTTPTNKQNAETSMSIAPIRCVVEASFTCWWLSFEQVIVSLMPFPGNQGDNATDYVRGSTRFPFRYHDFRGESSLIQFGGC